MARFSFIVRVLYAAAFVFAFIDNLSIRVEYFSLYGWRMPGIPLWSDVYFYSLLFIDPLISSLLLVRPRVGLVAAGFVVITNIGHNTWLLRPMSAPPGFMYWLTVGFLVFYLLTVFPVWRGSDTSLPPPENA